MADGTGALRRSCALGLLMLTNAACTPAIRELPEVPGETLSAAPETRNESSRRWSYRDGSEGPESWASLAESHCGGDRQSPIDVPLGALSSSPAASDASGALSGSAQSYELEGSELPVVATNDRRLLTLAGSSAVRLKVRGESATLDEVRVHVPAEHRLGGVLPEAELEFVFSGASAGFSLSVLFRSGAPSAELGALLEVLPETAEYQGRALETRLALSGLFRGKDILEYDGSMSTPPCAPVTRLIVARVAELSTQQLEQLFRVAPRPSARPLNESGSRQVRLASLVLTASGLPASDSHSTTPNSP